MITCICLQFDDVPMPDFMGDTLEELGIGTLQNIATVCCLSAFLQSLFEFRSLTRMTFVFKSFLISKCG